MAQKPIRLDDDVYTSTSQMAKNDGRSHANMVNHLLRRSLEGQVATRKPDELEISELLVPEKESYSCPHCGAVSHNANDVKERYCGACHKYDVLPVWVDTPETPEKIEAAPDTRTPGDVLADVRDAERERDEEIRYCQDPQEAAKIMDRWKNIIQPLWDEYHAMADARKDQ